MELKEVLEWALVEVLRNHMELDTVLVMEEVLVSSIVWSIVWSMDHHNILVGGMEVSLQ